MKKLKVCWRPVPANGIPATYPEKSSCACPVRLPLAGRRRTASEGIRAARVVETSAKVERRRNIVELLQSKIDGER